MGKIRTRILGLEDVEKKQKAEQKRKAQEKKQVKHKIRAQGLKGGERMAQVEVGEEAVEKMEKAKKILEGPASVPLSGTSRGKEKAKKVKVHRRGTNYKKAKREIEQYSKKFEVRSEKLGDEKKDKKELPTSNLSTSLKTSLQLLTLDQAIKLLKQIKYAKFDESVELHLNLNKEGIKGEVELPHSTGKSIRIKIIDEKVLADIEKGVFDFDLLIAHPQYMPRLVRFAKVLGPKGLMPNPKAGTISPNPEQVAKKFAKGTLRWKTEAKAPLIHQMIGKISFTEKALVENASAFLASVGKNHIQTAFIKTTMSPSIKINMESLS